MQRNLNRKNKALSEAAALLVLQIKYQALVSEAVTAGARQSRACEIVGLTARTLQRRHNDPSQADRRPDRVQNPHNRFSKIECHRILSIINSPDYGHLSPCQIVPRLADKGLYVASESTMYRLLRRTGQLKHRGVERQRRAHRKPRPVSATAPNELYSWDITYMPSCVKGQ